MADKRLHSIQGRKLQIQKSHQSFWPMQYTQTAIFLWSKTLWSNISKNERDKNNSY